MSFDFGQIATWVASLIVSFASKYTAVAGVVMVVGTLRLIMKPLFTFLHSVVDATPTTKDNELLDTVEKSGFMKVVTFILDLFASVKIPVSK